MNPESTLSIAPSVHHDYQFRFVGGIVAVMKPSMYYKFELVSIIRQHPFLFFPLIRVNNRVRGWDWPAFVAQDTELVLEGYFRTGNTFAVRAFNISQHEPRKVAHHTHAIATLVVAANRSLPTLVLLRRPADTVISAVQKAPGTTLAQHLKWYVRYYEAVDSLCKHFYIASFDELTADFGQVIQNLNQRFKTDFRPFEHTRENVQKVFDWIEAMDRGIYSSSNTQYSIPLPEKGAVKNVMLQELEKQEYRRLLDKADQLYDTICEKRMEGVP